MLQLETMPLPLDGAASEEILTLVHRETRQLTADAEALAIAIGPEAALARLRAPVSRQWAVGNWNEFMLYPLKGDNMVDLGCGTDDSFRNQLAGLGIAGYLGVDYFTGNTIEYTEGIGKTADISSEMDMPAAVIQADMLELASRLPDASCSVALNGIDDHVVDSGSAYGRELIRQIHRIVRVGGYVLGVSERYGMLMEFGSRMGYERDERPGIGTQYVYSRHQKLV